MRKRRREEARLVPETARRKSAPGNYPQGRVTDHRIKLTLHKLDSIINGDLNEVIDSLIAADQAAKLAKNESELSRKGEGIMTRTKLYSELFNRYNRERRQFFF